MAKKHRLTYLHRRLLTGELYIVQHPKRILAIALLLLLGCGALAWWYLRISTDQDQLFSSNVPFFRNYVEFTQDFPENQASYVVIQAKDPAHPPAVERWTAIADAITARLQKETRYVRLADSHIPIDQLGSQALLFEDPASLRLEAASIQRMIPLVQRWGEAPSFLDRSLLGSTPMVRFLTYVQFQSGGSETADFVKLLASGWNAALADPNKPIQVGAQVPDLSTIGAQDPGRLGYYYMPEEKESSHHLLLVRVSANADFSSMNGMAQAIDAIRSAAREAGADFPEFTVGLTGRPVLEADEMVTTDRDSRRSEIAALLAIFVGLVVLFRSIWLAISAEIALLVGIGWTFGWATASIGELNLLSMVFLIALIGIGMDYLIQVLSRYRREITRHQDPRIVWAAVFKYVAAPINTACLGAAGAFFVSIFTNFRGAAELGIIASGGLLLCLLAGYVILPALLTIFPLRPPANPALEIPAFDPESGRSHHTLLALPVLWTLLLLAGIPLALRAHFDPSLLNMQAQNLESVQLVQKLQTWSAVVLSKDLDQLRPVRAKIEQLPTVAGTESLLRAYDNYDWLHKHQAEIPTVNWASPAPIQPRDLTQLAGTARALAAKFKQAVKTSDDSFAQAMESLNAFAGNLSKLSDAEKTTAAAALSTWQTVFVGHLQKVLAPFHPGPPDLTRLPPLLHDHFIGQDGRFALYITPVQDLWKQAYLEKFVKDVESADASVPNAPPVTGIAINVYHSTSSIEKSFYHATTYALLLIFMLVLLDLRNLRQTLLAISVLAVGLPMLIILMGWMNISWNFANFFGLPILIGAGHEYGVFMVHRFNEACKDPRRAWKKWDVSDRALLACAFVTTASFGFFWALGHHRGLKSLGLVMALGTMCIYLATLCVLRPLLLWQLARQARRYSKTGVSDCATV